MSCFCHDLAIFLRYHTGMMKKFLAPLYILCLIAFLWLAMATRPEPQIELVLTLSDEDFGMQLPADYRQTFVHYMTVDRPDQTIRLLYAHPTALDAVERGEALPFGSQFIIETWDAALDMFGNVRRDADGHLIAETLRPNVHMMEKRANWTIEQLPTAIGVIDWNFGSFEAESLLPTDENRNDCMTCHDSGAFRRDFIFSHRVIADYLAEERPQYLYCRAIARGNCIR